MSNPLTTLNPVCFFAAASAIANAKKPILMARSFKNAVISGRQSYLAGRMKTDTKANPSSPMKGIVNS